MSQTSDFYHARAEASAAEARSATLENVRVRALRSEDVWRGLAAAQLRIDTARIEREKSAQVAAIQRTALSGPIDP
jgi:hypothetical protein